jgi:hypothetical protein
LQYRGNEEWQSRKIGEVVPGSHTGNAELQILTDDEEKSRQCCRPFPVIRLD